jgi:transcriptional antiterminator NusG
MVSKSDEMAELCHDIESVGCSMDYLEWAESMKNALALDEVQRYTNNWYVLFVLTGHENEAMRDVNLMLPRDFARPFLPTVVLPFKRGSIVKHEIKLIFPGYLFVETDAIFNDFADEIYPCLRRSEHIMKLLNYGGWQEVSIHDEERRCLESLWREDNQRIESSKGILHDGRVVVIEGPLRDQEGKIRKLIRHKMQAVVDIELLNECREIAIGLEIV